jgi:hypothetical protein
MAKAKKLCPHCGAAMMEYRHTLNRGLVTALFRLYQAGKGVNLKDLGLTRNQWDNFQKLRYWGLVEKVFERGKRKSGVWKVTGPGEAFLKCKMSVPRSVWSYRGSFVRWGDPTDLCTVVDFFPAFYGRKEEYARRARPGTVEGYGL